MIFPSGTLTKRFIDWWIEKTMIIYHALMYLACEQMETRVKQLQGKKWARQPIDIVCTRVDNSQWKLDISLWKIFCVGVKQLQLEDRNQS